jgi:hypothetical protein
MSFKPDQNDWMAYLYDEMDHAEREKMEHYLLSNPGARKELEQYRNMRKLMSAVTDKEVIAPPIVVGDSKQRFIWNSPYLKVTVSVAASLLIIMLVGRLTGMQVGVSDSEFRISFGEPKAAPPVKLQDRGLSSEQVQQMINASLNENNLAMKASWTETQQKLDASIKNNLASNSGKIDKLVREASTASQDQIQQYVSTLQTQNMQLVKDYFQLTSGEQKEYIENLLVDFAKYLQQQRNDDLQLVEMRLNSIETNTNSFQQETEQILSSIISTVGTTPTTKETKY